MSTTMVFPENVLFLHGTDFYHFIQERCGQVIVEIFKIQEISSVDSLLRIDNIFSFFNLDSEHLRSIKEKIGFYLNDGSFIIKPGIVTKVEILVNALHQLNQRQMSCTTSGDIVISDAVLRKFPFLQQILQFVHNSEDPQDPALTFLYKFIENTFSNLMQAKSRYRYQEHIKRFGLTLFLLGGRNLYEFIHLNLPGSLPCVRTLETAIAESSQEIIEGNFRYDLATEYLISKQSEYVFCSEDCTAVVPKVIYDSRTNTFIGFSLPLSKGYPKIEYYSTNSFQQLENWFNTESQSKLLNIHMIQPLSSQSVELSPYLLSSYGTDGRFTSNDIIHRWKKTFDRFLERGIRILGYSTDCDSKYLRAMRLITGFFTASLDQNALFDHHTFVVASCSNWVWFHLRPQQKFLCLQDPIHLATKLRNRLLSSKATMLLGNKSISINFLLKLIIDFSKLDHGLVKSDVIPKDRQNFSSCTKISSDCVLQTLEKMQGTLAICIYLKIIKYVRLAFIEKNIECVDRIYYAWLCTFICRLWLTWLIKTPINKLCSGESQNFDSSLSNSRRKSKSRFFITNPAYLSIEMNAHTIIYISLLVINKQLPPEALQIWLFSSQTCESMFRTARSMSGPFSSVVNFSVAQFLRRAEKLSVLQTIKSEAESDPNFLFHFPHHHKQTKLQQFMPTVPIFSSLSSDEIKQVVERAFADARELLAPLDVHVLNKDGNPLSINEVSAIVKDHFEKTATISDSNQVESSDSDSESDNELNSFDTENDSIVAESENDQDMPDSKCSSSDSNCSFRGMRIYDYIKSSHVESYFKVIVNGRTKFLHKQTACWLLMHDKSSLSSDRSRRVMNK